MFARNISLLLKARPKTVSIEPGSNRLIDAKSLEKAKEVFARPPFQNKLVLHNWRYFIKPGKVTTGSPLAREFPKVGLKATEFTKVLNDRTKPHFKDDVELIVRIQVYFDKSFIYNIEPPPTAWFILRAVRKKKGQTGSVPVKNSYAALITLEMCYEIAKMKQMDWGKLEYPPIETRVRRVIGQARRMGICIIGVDTHDSPLKDKTAKEYAKECEQYREIHMKQYQELKQKELLEAPLYERLHRVNLAPLTNDQLESGMKDANLFNALWTASHPKNAYMRDLHSREVARRYLNSRGWFTEMTPEEMRTVFLNYRLPEEEQQRQMGQSSEIGGAELYWSRDSAHSTPKPTS